MLIISSWGKAKQFGLIQSSSATPQFRLKFVPQICGTEFHPEICTFDGRVIAFCHPKRKLHEFTGLHTDLFTMSLLFCNTSHLLHVQTHSFSSQIINDQSNTLRFYVFSSFCWNQKTEAKPMRLFVNETNKKHWLNQPTSLQPAVTSPNPHAKTHQAWVLRRLVAPTFQRSQEWWGWDGQSIHWPTKKHWQIWQANMLLPTKIYGCPLFEMQTKCWKCFHNVMALLSICK